MDTVDPAAEWRRLEELYRQMSEDELQVVADEAYDLTEIAREVLQREIGTRGVDITLREEPAPPPEPEPDPETEGFDPAELDLIVVIAFGTQSKQDTTSRSSIMRECRRISVRTISRTLMITPGYERGVELKIRAVDQQRASHAFAMAPRPEGEEPPDPRADEDYEVRCPKCHSTEVVFEGLEKDSPKESDFDATYQWSCDACGYAWKDDGVEQNG